jgi:hypothetical protein
MDVQLTAMGRDELREGIGLAGPRSVEERRRHGGILASPVLILPIRPSLR